MDSARRKHFFHHANKSETPAAGTKDCHWCQLKAFANSITAPVNIINTVDKALIPNNFRFVDAVVVSSKVQRAGDDFRSGCSCSEHAACNSKDCSCLQDTGDYDEDSKDACGNFAKLQYHTNGTRASLLRSKFLQSKFALYECHDGCSCPSSCPSRVVDRGRTIPLQIFRTEDRGWGVRSQVNIKKGQFIDRYLGEIITSKEADKRRNESAVSQRKDVYLFALDKFTSDNDTPNEVDGEFVSGPTRFINHSCNPNLRIFARVGDLVDKDIHDLAFFAVKDIQRGEELTFDYVDGNAEEDDEVEDHGDKAECLCGASNCRKFLW